MQNMAAGLRFDMHDRGTVIGQMLADYRPGCKCREFNDLDSL